MALSVLIYATLLDPYSEKIPWVSATIRVNRDGASAMIIPFVE